MKALRRIINIVTTLLVALVVLLAVALVGVRIFGLTPYVVLSGSMEPTYHVGSLIYVKEVAPESVQVGDPITFVLDESLTVVTHRVIEIDADTQHFYTKGDANDVADGSPVYWPNLLGKPVFSIPYLGYVSDFVQHPPGTYVAISAAAIILLLAFVPDLIRKVDDGEKKCK